MSSAPSAPHLGPESEAFLSWLAIEKGRAPNTLAAYRRDLFGYEAFLADRSTGVADVDEDQLVDYLRKRQRSGQAAATVARAMVAVRALHRFLVAEGLRDDDPTADVEPPRVPRGLPKALSEADVERLLGAVQGDGPAAYRDRAMLELLYGSGVRISELVGLSLSDLDRTERLMRVFGKGNKERVVPVGRLAFDALEAWLSPRGRASMEPKRWASKDDADAVFLNRAGGRLSRQGAWGVVKKYAAQVGLGAQLSPHTLRHCCATHMLDHGADIRTVQELLGHASVTTTQIYTAVSREHLLAVYRQAHPRATGAP